MEGRQERVAVNNMHYICMKLSRNKFNKIFSVAKVLRLVV